MPIQDTSESGYTGFEGNERTTGSVVNDPAKDRLTTPIAETGGGGGAVSFNANQLGDRALGGRQREMAMLRVEQAEDVRGDVGNLKAEFNFLVNDGSGDGDAAMVKPLAFTADGFTHFSPALLQSLRQWLGGAAVTDTMWAPSGLFFTQQQADGNFVSYRVDRPFDKSANPVALWSAWTGKL